MINSVIRKLLLVVGLTLISFQINAATATTTVSANIVPKASLFMSGNIILAKNFNTYQDKTQTRANSVNIETSAFNRKNSAKIKINTSHNASYDISISPSSTLTNSSSSKIEIKKIRTLNNFETVNNNTEQELVIEAVLKDADSEDAGFYFGTVEINVNYN